MKEFKEKVKSIPLELFSEINELLKKHGVENAEVSNIKIKHNNPTIHSCPPGKELYCWVDASGRTHCRCI